MRLCGISSRFQLLSPCIGQVTHALLTRPPLSHKSVTPKGSWINASFDLHVLSTPPAFILSQDQTLMFNVLLCSDKPWLLPRLSERFILNFLGSELSFRRIFLPNAFLVFRLLSHCSVVNVLCLPLRSLVRQLNQYNTLFCLCQEKLLNFLKKY